MSIPASLHLPRARVYPQRDEPTRGWHRHLADRMGGLYHAFTLPRRSIRARAFVRAVRGQRDHLQALDAAALAEYRDQLRLDLARNGFAGDEVIARAFALVREVSRRVLGLEHYDVQIEGGLALLDGVVAELDTGEGKTLTATLAAATAALAGTPVHVITVNDYLATRDAGLMEPLYRALGLSVGIVVAGLDAAQRQAAYACDIAYCSNKEIAFDYLRDRIGTGDLDSDIRNKFRRLRAPADGRTGPVMRGLHFAIVDEADSVLIDEARTPLIISRRSDPALEQKRAEEALALAGLLSPTRDFVVRAAGGRIDLTAQGQARLEQHAAEYAGAWCGRLYREQQVCTALSALHLLVRDDHYLVRDDKVEIIDENTGRVMPDRSWSDGLHQMVEAKEGCSVTGQSVPVARMTFQRFFRRYRRLAGMTGTGREAAAELWSVYRLPVRRIATNRPAARRHAHPVVVTTVEEKWQCIARRAADCVSRGVPVLIGTRSVAASEALSRCLHDAGIAHNVLNAAQDADEAAVIARAGQAGQVTVATNMAGRGVDIRLGPDVIERGGLHVIMSERHDSARIDRQFFGRCGRQGEPGTVVVMVSLEDSLLADPPVAGRLFAARLGAAGWLFARAQKGRERRHAQMRRDLLRSDEQLGDALAFSGRLE